MIKKIILIVTLVAAVALPARSQFRYGPTVGVDITTLKFNQSLIDVSSAVGEQAGVNCELMFPGIGFGIEFGLQYVQRGATLHLDSQVVWSECGAPRSYLHYIELPVNLKFKWTRLNGWEEKIAPFVYGGPTFSILAGHNRIDALDYAGGDFGLQAGIGAEVFHRWQLSASYCWGMSYAIKTVKLDNFVARNRTWSIRLAYLF